MAPAVHYPLTAKETQELLNLAGYPCTIDGQAGPVTRFCLAAYTASHVAPLDATFSALEHGAPLVASADSDLGDFALELARWYLGRGAREIGGQNLGPWVRYFSGGQEGDPVAWCAWFAAVTCVGQAAARIAEARDRAGLDGSKFLEVAERYRSPSCTTILRRAKEDSRLVTDLAKVRPGMLILLLEGESGARHVGIVEAVDVATKRALTVEGNSNDASDPGGRDRVARHLRDVSQGVAFVDLAPMLDVDC